MSEQTISGVASDTWKHWGNERKFKPTRIDVGGRSVVMRTNGAVMLLEEVDGDHAPAADLYDNVGLNTIRAIAELPRPRKQFPFIDLRLFAGPNTSIVAGSVKRVGVCGRHVNIRQLAFALSYVDAETVAVGASGIGANPGLLIERVDLAGPWWRIFIMGLRRGRGSFFLHDVFPADSTRKDVPVKHSRSAQPQTEALQKGNEQ